jgi:hypothetical protein
MSWMRSPPRLLDTSVLYEYHHYHPPSPSPLPKYVQTSVAILGPTPGSNIRSSNVRGMSPAYCSCMCEKQRKKGTKRESETLAGHICWLLLFSSSQPAPITVSPLPPTRPP